MPYLLGQREGLVVVSGACQPVPRVETPGCLLQCELLFADAKLLARLVADLGEILDGRGRDPVAPRGRIEHYNMRHCARRCSVCGLEAMAKASNAWRMRMQAQRQAEDVEGRLARAWPGGSSLGLV